MPSLLQHISLAGDTKKLDRIIVYFDKTGGNSIKAFSEAKKNVMQQSFLIK